MAYLKYFIIYEISTLKVQKWGQNLFRYEVKKRFIQFLKLRVARVGLKLQFTKKAT